MLVKLGQVRARLASTLIPGVALLDLSALVLRHIGAGVDALVAGVKNSAFVKLTPGATTGGLAALATLANKAAADEGSPLGEKQLELLATLLMGADEGLPEVGRIVLARGPSHLGCSLT